MSQEFSLALQEGLQGLLVVAVLCALVHRGGRGDLIGAVRWGLAASMPSSLAAGVWFLETADQAQWEATLALASAGFVIWLCRVARRMAAGVPTVFTTPLAAGGLPAALMGATIVLVVRQGMETAALAHALAFQLGSPEGLARIGAGLTLAGLTAWLGCRMLRCLEARTFFKVVRAFLALFALQLLVYGFHESTEAAWLPYSDVLHAATEPYGPDGRHGQQAVYLLILVPLLTALATSVRVPETVASRARAIGVAMRPSWRAFGVAVLTVLAIMAVGMYRARIAHPAPSESPARAASATFPGLPAAPARPFVLFRNVASGSGFARVAMAPVDARHGARFNTGLPCERVHFAAGTGVCLTAERNFFTTYRGIVFDDRLDERASFPVRGLPSRVRVAPDGRIAAYTVFERGHSYNAEGFSTRTFLIDTATGAALVDLEEFAVSRAGERVAAPDHNFWGVTFANDGATFYATLATGGRTHLIRGNVAAKTATILRENVECPSLSPDGARLAYKKKMPTQSGAVWQLHVLDLSSMTETALGTDVRDVDDQLEWLDTEHVLYAHPEQATGGRNNVWVLAADGKGSPRVYLPHAESPAVVR
jgi:hypothetical protein